MRVAIYIPGMPVDANILENASLGGSETMGALLGRALVEQGHQATLHTNCAQPHGWRGVWIEPIGNVSPSASLGDRFMAGAATVPCDALIVQRHPTPFGFVTQARTNWFWAHDLARVRTRGAFRSSGWNCNGVLAVSEWHRKQVESVYGLLPGYTHVLRNGIDLDLFKKAVSPEVKRMGKFIVYSSRPERGLRYLVRPDGIMERLLKIDPSITLQVCFYDNTVPETTALYDSLFAQCRALPNVELVGALNKRQLAGLMLNAALLVYPTVPTVEHEETSCISLMEAQAAGTPFIVCDGGAVSETVGGSAVDRGALIPYLPDGQVDVDNFAQTILSYLLNDGYSRASNAGRAHAAVTYDFRQAARDFIDLVGRTLSRSMENPVRLVTSLYEQGDVQHGNAVPVERPTAYIRAQRRLSAFLDTPEAYAAHNARSAELFLKYTNADQPNKWNLNAVTDHPANRQILEVVEREMQKGAARVLDFGCGLGLLSMYMAERWPESTFVGVDIADANVQVARRQAKLRELKNITFLVSDFSAGPGFDIVICAETVEHVQEQPGPFVAALERLAKPGGQMILTFPSTKHDRHERAAGEEERTEHVRFIPFDQSTALWGKKPNFHERYFAIQPNKWFGGVVGGVLIEFIVDQAQPVAAPPIILSPRETLGGLIIVRGDDTGIDKTLASIHEVCDRIVVGIDATHIYDAERWRKLALAYPRCEMFTLQHPPLTAGFDAARNEVLDRLDTDWVFWIDSDEELRYGERMLKFLRPNCYHAYGIAQVHLSMEPPGVLRTDYPCRLFRRDLGLRFFGLVHEHPCFSAELPPSQVMLLGDGIAISHPGYATEAVRRARFVRNFPLMRRDIETYPTRPLGQYLWTRDLMHQVRFGIEQGQPPNIKLCEEAIDLFRKMLAKEDLGMLREMLPYSSEAVKYVYGPRAVAVKVQIEAARYGYNPAAGDPQGTQPIEALVPDDVSAHALVALVSKARISGLSERYL